MKKLLTIATIILTSCAGSMQVTWKVTSYHYDHIKGAYIITASSARGSDTFITDCKPDSIGAHFWAPPKPIKK